MKSGKLNFLEPSGPLQASNGTALPLWNLEVRYPVHKVQTLVSVLRNLPLYVLYFSLEGFTNIKTRIL